MFWNKKTDVAHAPRQLKLASSLEKGERFGETSSFGSADAHVNAPVKAHLPPSPTSPYYGQTFDSSNQTSSRQTRSSAKPANWFRRHWFIILLIILIVFAGAIVAILMLVKARADNSTKNIVILTDQLLPTSALSPTALS